MSDALVRPPTGSKNQPVIPPPPPPKEGTIAVSPEAKDAAIKSNEELHSFNNQAMSDAFGAFKEEVGRQYSKQFAGMTLRVSGQVGVEGLDQNGKQMFGFTSALRGVIILPATPGGTAEGEPKEVPPAKG